VRAHAGARLRSATNGGKLTHPGIVSIYAAGEVDGLLYYVMPFVDGETLRDRLDREHQLALDDVTLIVRDVADALDHAHRRNIVHRDIKPQNILLHEGRAFVADFGIAKAVHEQDAHVLTEDGLAVGTAEYMSPEQIRGSAHLDARADIYALGCVVYDILTGEAPFRGRTIQSIISRQLSDTASPMRILRQTLPAGLDDVVRRALAKSPNDRFASVIDFASAVIQAIDPAAVVRFHTPTGRTPHPFPITDVVAWPRRRRILWAGAALAVLGGAAAAGAVWHSTPPTPPTPSPTSTAIRIAVRAVDNLTGSATNETAVDLLTADLINQLHHLVDVEVKDRSSSIALRQSKLTTRQIAESLEVTHVIESDLELSADTLVLKASLADSTGRILRPARAEWRASEFGLMRVRDSAVRALIEQLVAGLPRPVTLARRRRHEHLLGHDQLLNGSRQLAMRTVNGLRGALAEFDAAIAIDPDYAEAYAELSKAYSLALIYRYRLGIDPYDAAGRALAAADRAITRHKPRCGWIVHTIAHQMGSPWTSLNRSSSLLCAPIPSSRVSSIARGAAPQTALSWRGRQRPSGSNPDRRHRPLPYVESYEGAPLELTAEYAIHECLEVRTLGYFPGSPRPAYAASCLWFGARGHRTTAA
jgi:serine/threonine protein kinase